MKKYQKDQEGNQQIHRKRDQTKNPLKNKQTRHQ